MADLYESIFGDMPTDIAAEMIVRAMDLQAHMHNDEVRAEFEQIHARYENSDNLMRFAHWRRDGIYRLVGERDKREGTYVAIKNSIDALCEQTGQDFSRLHDVLLQACDYGINPIEYVKSHSDNLDAGMISLLTSYDALSLFTPPEYFKEGIKDWSRTDMLIGEALDKGISIRLVSVSNKRTRRIEFYKPDANEPFSWNEGNTLADILKGPEGYKFNMKSQKDPRYYNARYVPALDRVESAIINYGDEIWIHKKGDLIELELKTRSGITTCTNGRTFSHAYSEFNRRFEGIDIF